MLFHTQRLDVLRRLVRLLQGRPGFSCCSCSAASLAAADMLVQVSDACMHALPALGFKACCSVSNTQLAVVQTQHSNAFFQIGYARKPRWMSVC